MRVQNIFDIALFDSGLAENIFVDTIFTDVMPHTHSSKKDLDLVKKQSPRIAFAPYPLHFASKVSKAKARPLATA